MKVGPWIPIRRLGSGGNGVVWQCSPEDGGNDWPAVKFYTQDTNTGRQRFNDEIEILKHLAGRPGVLPLLDSYSPEDGDNGDEPPWLSMPVAKPLGIHLANTDITTVVSCIRDVAAVIDTLAAEDISHRDVKPENLFWWNGAAAIGDFGLASFPDKGAITAEGKKLGPLHYIAPEMLRDASRAKGAPADVYSLAKTLWVLVTGQTYPPGGEIRVDVPQLTISGFVAHSRTIYLDRLVERATRTDPARRPTMSEVVGELDAWLHPGTGTIEAPDLSSTIERISVLSEPSVRAAEQRSDTVRHAVAYFAQILDAARGIQGHLQAAVRTKVTLEADGILAAESAEIQACGAPEIIWSNSLTIRVPSPQAYPFYILCSIAVELYEEDTLRLFGGFYLDNPPGITQTIGGAEYVFQAEVGSALARNSQIDMMKALYDRLPEVIKLYADILEERFGVG